MTRDHVRTVAVDTADLLDFVERVARGEVRHPVPEARRILGIPVVSVGTLKHRAGGDMAEWPADLRVRETPTTTQED